MDRLVLVIALVLAAANPSHADVGVIVLEPIEALGFWTRVGHAATYLSNICPDGSPIRMRMCRSGERGGVVSKYTPISAHEDYDWAIVPFEQYLHGFESSDLAPVIGTDKLLRAIERQNFNPLFSSALTSTSTGELPDGEWKATLATRFRRSIFVLSISTTATDDARIVAAFNTAPNKSRFNFFYDNCSNQAKSFFDLVLGDGTIGERVSGLTMETPKGLAKTLVDRAFASPALHLQVRRYPQVPGTFSRSRNVLFPMENMYRSVGFAPYWMFGGFREVALGAMFYHQVLSPFGMLDAFRHFLSPKASQLTFEQRRLRQQQDDVRLTLASLETQGARRVTLIQASATIFQRLRDIRSEQQAEVSRVLGSKVEWQELDRGFQSTLRALDGRFFVPDELKAHFVQFEPTGRLSEHLLRYFEVQGEFYIDEAGGPWIKLVLGDGEAHATGLAKSQILAGDPRLATLVLAAVIDYNLSQSDARRADIEDMRAMFSLFRKATGAAVIGRNSHAPGIIAGSPLRTPY